MAAEAQLAARKAEVEAVAKEAANFKVKTSTHGSADKISAPPLHLRMPQLLGACEQSKRSVRMAQCTGRRHCGCHEAAL